MTDLELEIELSSASVDLDQLEHQIQKKFSQFLEKHDFDSLKGLQAATNNNPDEKIIRDAYDSYLLNGKIDEIVTLQEISDLEPEFSDEIIQQAYVCCLDSYFSYTLKRFEKVQDYTGVKPNLPKEAVQKRYDVIFEKEWFDHLIKLEKITGIKSEFPKEEVLEKYYISLMGGNIGSDRWDYKKFCDLFELTGVRPDDESLKLFNSNTVRGDPDWFKRFQQLSGIKPLEDDIQLAYKFALEGGNFKDMDMIYELTGIKVSEDVVQKCYLKELKEDMFCYSTIEEIVEVTKVQLNLPEEEIQKIYLSQLLDGEFNTFKSLRNSSGIQPRESNIQGAYMSYFKRDNMHRIRFLKKLTGIQPNLPEKDVQRKYDQLASSNSLDEFKELIKISGIAPIDYVVQKAYNHFLEHEQLDNLGKMYDITKIKPKKSFAVHRYLIADMKGMKNDR